MTYLLKINDRRYEIPNFVIWSPSYASAKTLVLEGSISSFTFMGNYYSYVSLFHPEDEFSLKEMHMWSQPKTSSSCFCVWSKSKELGGRGSTRFPASMVESFSTDFFPAIEGYWTESQLEFCQTSTTELLYENMWSVFR